MTEPKPIPPEYITTGCGPGRRIMGELERRAVDEQRGADRMARAMVAALYWRAGERAALVREFGDVPRAALHYANEASALIGAAQRLEACL